MKTMKTRFLSLLAITALLFVSCSDDDNIPEANDGMVKFSSGVSGLQSRVGGADGDVWAQDDPIGVYMRDNAVGKAIVSENIQYNAQSAGTATSFTSNTPIYYPVNDPAKVDFVAYHPYQTPLTDDYGYAVDVSDQADQSAIDLMVSTADNNGAGYDKTNPSAVNLKFRHQLAKVILVVSKGAGVDNLTGLTVSIGGMNTTADFDISTATLSNETDVADITPYDAGSDRYEVILLPVTALDANHVVEFTVGGNTYKWTMKENDRSIDKLETGKKYTFNVTLKKNAVSVTGTIDEWEDVGVSNGTAN